MPTAKEREEKKALKLQMEMQRIEEMCTYEKEYEEYTYICGIDEAGRGPFAGPVVAGAVILPKGSRILYVNNNANAASILKNLMPGDILSGIINQIKESQVLIGFNDGSLLSAHLTGDANVAKGDNITFLVKDISNSQISLKVISQGEQQNMFIGKALEAAGLYATDENTAMIKELLSLNMPVNS